MDPIDRMEAHLRAAEPWVRPYAMEALIRHGADPRDVQARFDLTDEERTKLDALLRLPRVS